MIPIPSHNQTKWLTKRVEKFLVTNCGYNRLKSVKLSEAYKTFSTKKKVDELKEKCKEVIVRESIKLNDENEIKQKFNAGIGYLKGKNKKNVQTNQPVLPAVLMTFNQNHVKRIPQLI